MCLFARAAEIKISQFTLVIDHEGHEEHEVLYFILRALRVLRGKKY